MAEKIRTFLQLGLITSTDDEYDRISAEDEDKVPEKNEDLDITQPTAPLLAASVASGAETSPKDTVAKEDDLVAKASDEPVAAGDSAEMKKEDGGQVSGNSSSDEGFEKIEESELLTQDPAVAP